MKRFIHAVLLYSVKVPFNNICNSERLKCFNVPSLLRLSSVISHLLKHYDLCLNHYNLNY